VITNSASALVKDFGECCSEETKVIADLIQLSIRICAPVAHRGARRGYHIISGFAGLLKAVVLGIFGHWKFSVFFWPLARFIG
jgi:hypothetical protein